ncbi:MAG: ABC-F family ATP-binding cassette domain-containing protein [Chloroflexi bacterium]|nr:ABC-F family ATP-binding cassette domain-containing protein [Chloroflexota bacterium]
MLQASNLTKGYPDRPLFDKANFCINQGDRVGLVGPNGCGKTTLLLLLIGSETPDTGSVRRTVPNLRIGYLPQGLTHAPDATLRSVLAEATDGGADALPDYRVAELLAGLGLGDLAPETPVEILSGGQKTRLGLARLLALNPNLLLLDEPTNHLDIGALEWLERYLQGYGGAVLVVSHDRTFLDHTVTRILEIDPLTRQVNAWEGDYTCYAAAKERDLVRRQQAYALQQERIAQLESSVRRLEGQARNIESETIHFYYKKRARKVARQAVVQRRRVERLLDSEERLDRPETGFTLKLDFVTTPTSGQDVLSLLGLGKRYGERWLFREASLVLRRGERIALTGPNGSGKTTLLRIITGEEPATEGAVQHGANVQIGYLSQEQEGLDPTATPFEAVRQAAALSETQARTYLHYLVFPGDEVFKPIGRLSFGERARLALGVLVLQLCNLLLLDEPINHLDIPSRERFEQALQPFTGTVLAVVHDRYFVQRYATGVWSLEAGTLRRYVDLEDLRRGQAGP